MKNKLYVYICLAASFMGCSQNKISEEDDLVENSKVNIESEKETLEDELIEQDVLVWYQIPEL
jgi:hypothetical protein